MSYVGPGGPPAPGLLQLELWDQAGSSAGAGQADRGEEAVTIPMLLAAQPLLLLPAVATGGAPAGGDALLAEVIASAQALAQAEEEGMDEGEGEGEVKGQEEEAEMGSGACAWLQDIGAWLRHVHEVQAWGGDGQGHVTNSGVTSKSSSQHPDWGGAARSSLRLRMQDKVVAATMQDMAHGLLEHAQALGLQAIAQVVSEGLQLVDAAAASAEAHLANQQRGATMPCASIGSNSAIVANPAFSSGHGNSQGSGQQGRARGPAAAKGHGQVLAWWAPVRTLLLGFPQPGIEQEYGQWLAERIAGIALLWSPIFLSIQGACAHQSYLQGTLQEDMPCIALYSYTYILTILLAWGKQAHWLEAALLAALLNKALAMTLSGLGFIAWPTGKRCMSS